MQISVICVVRAVCVPRLFRSFLQNGIYLIEAFADLLRGEISRRKFELVGQDIGEVSSNIVVVPVTH